MQQLIGIGLSKFIIEFFLELGIQGRVVPLGLLPLLSRAKLLDTGEREWLVGIELGHVFVLSQIHLEV